MLHNILGANQICIKRTCATRIHILLCTYTSTEAYMGGGGGGRVVGKVEGRPVGGGCA